MRKQGNKDYEYLVDNKLMPGDYTVIMPIPALPAPPVIHSMGFIDPSLTHAGQIELMFRRCIERSNGFNAGKEHDKYYVSKHIKGPIYCGYCNKKIVEQFGVEDIFCGESCEIEIEIERDKTKVYSSVGRFLDYLVILWRLIK